VSRAATLLLGVAFLMAGAAKLASAGWPAQADAMGAPRPVARVLPVVEIVLGALLLVGLGEPWTVLVAAVLLLGFTGVLVLRLTQGRRVPCACFGTTRRPISWWTVGRNVALLAVAGIALVAS
jgi:uncharacterized membrane protein YphA (DoxX/SURF4 family)